MPKKPPSEQCIAARKAAAAFRKAKRARKEARLAENRAKNLYERQLALSKPKKVRKKKSVESDDEATL